VIAPILQRRIVSRGDLPGSDGGVYNPGAVWMDDAILMLCRREIDYRFTTRVFPECVLVDPDTFAVRRHWTLARGPGLARKRAEDFRLLRHDGELLAVHTLVERGRIKPVLSAVRGRRLELVDPLELPLPLRRVEKNWVLFEHDGALHCLYQLDPLLILRRRRAGRWVVVRERWTGLQDGHDHLLSNSTNLIPFRGGYLGFWHTAVHRRYVQGAFLLDADLELVARTGVLLDGADVIDGWKPGVLYVSALVEYAGQVLAFYGEGDAHAGVAVFAAAALAAELERSPHRTGSHQVPRVRRHRAHCPLCDPPPPARPTS